MVQEAVDAKLKGSRSHVPTPAYMATICAKRLRKKMLETQYWPYCRSKGMSASFGMTSAAVLQAKPRLLVSRSGTGGTGFGASGSRRRAIRRFSQAWEIGEDACNFDHVAMARLCLLISSCLAPRHKLCTLASAGHQRNWQGSHHPTDLRMGCLTAWTLKLNEISLPSASGITPHYRLHSS